MGHRRMNCRPCIIWGQVRRIGQMWGIVWGLWFIGIARRYAPDPVYQYPKEEQ